MYTPVNPKFTIQKWGTKWYKSYGRVIMMSDCEKNGDLQELEINLTVILDIFNFRHIDFADGERRLVEPGRKPRRQFFGATRLLSCKRF